MAEFDRGRIHTGPSGTIPTGDGPLRRHGGDGGGQVPVEASAITTVRFGLGISMPSIW